MKAQVRKCYSHIRAIIQDLPKYLCFIFIKKKILPSQTNEIRHNHSKQWAGRTEQRSGWHEVSVFLFLVLFPFYAWVKTKTDLGHLYGLGWRAAKLQDSKLRGQDMSKLSKTKQKTQSTRIKWRQGKAIESNQWNPWGP